MTLQAGFRVLLAALVATASASTLVAAAQARPASIASRRSSSSGQVSPELVSVAAEGGPAGGVIDEVGMSANGRYVVFASTSPRLVAGDTNESSDIFVRDRKLHTTTRVSVTSTGEQTKAVFAPLPDESFWPRISANGQSVVFESWAGNLYQWPTGTGPHCEPWCPGEIGVHYYLHSMSSATTEMIDTSQSGAPANNSAVPQAAGIVLSASGRYAAFGSNATNLVPTEPGIEGAQVFVKDLMTGATERISETSSGETPKGDAGLGAPLAISANGNIIVFQSSLTLDPANPIDSIFVRNRARHTTTGLTSAFELTTNPGQLSADGRIYAALEQAAGYAIVWELEHLPQGATPIHAIGSVPLLSSDGSTMYFTSESEPLKDGLGGGVFSYARTTEGIERDTASPGFTLQATNKTGTIFAGQACATPSEQCRHEGSNVFVEKRSR